MADVDEPTYRHRRVPIALGSATVLVGLLAIRAWEAGVVGETDLLSAGVGVALGVAVVALERQEVELLLSLGGRLRGSVGLQLVLVFAILAAVTLLTTELTTWIDPGVFAGLATILLGELALLAYET